MAEAPVRNLVLVLGDELSLDSRAFDGFDPARDAVWMAEVTGARRAASGERRAATGVASIGEQILDKT